MQNTLVDQKTISTTNFMTKLSNKNKIDIVDMIARVKPPTTIDGKDRIYWHQTSGGNFTTASSYEMLGKTN